MVLRPHQVLRKDPNLQLIANYLLVALELNFLDRFDKSRCMAKVLGNERN